ncbi:MAG: hypothetical protein WA957_04740 [Alteraurantiacibacter sp.]
MAKSVQAFLDNRGGLHISPTSAVIGDIAAALGRVGDEGGLTEGVARLILDKRTAIEQAFADLDALGTVKSVGVEAPEGGTIEILDLEERRRNNG